MSLPPLPEGATLDALPPLPEGATLDADTPIAAPMPAPPEPVDVAPSITGFTAADVTAELARPHVSAFKAKVGLSDPWEGTARRYAQQRLEQEDLVRKAFKAGSEPGVDPDVLDARVATFFDIPVATVTAGRQGWLDTYAKASGDPRKWIDENPLSARLVLEHPERADQVVSDKTFNVAMKALNGAIDTVRDTWDKALRLEADMPWGGAAKAFRDTAGAAVAKANSLVIGADKAQAEVDALNVPRTPEQQKALDAERAQRDAPKPTTEVDSPAAAEVRAGGAFAIAGQRAREARAQLEVSKLYADLLWARRAKQDTTLLVQRIQEAEEAARGMKLDEGGATQVLADSWSTAQSTLGVLEASVEGMGDGAKVGGVMAFGITAWTTRNPQLSARAFIAGAGVGAKFGGAKEAAQASFTFELGDTFRQLLSTKTDAGKALTDDEAIGGSLIAAALKTGIEMAELSLIMKALGPGGAIFEKGGLDAVKAQLATNPGFRALAVKAAKAWVGEGVEEVAQGATDDAISYLVRSKHAGQLQAGPVIDVEARKQDFVGGLMAGSIFGAGSLAVSTTTHAVFKAREKSSAALSMPLAELAANPKAAAMAPELASLVQAKTAEQGDEVTHRYVDASAFRRLFQTDQAADAAATELMGADGPKKLANADFTGGKLVVPLEEYLAKWGKDDIAKKLADDTANRSDRPTPRELAEQQAADEEFAKRIAAENREPGVSPTLDRFDALEQQLVDSGRMSAETARESLVPLRQTFETLAKRFGQKVEDLFQNVRVQVDDGGKVLLLEARQAHASQRLSAELHQGLTPEQAAERLYVDDHVTSLYTFPAWELMQQESPAKSVATLTLTDIKPVNDSVLGGHDTANALLAHVAPAIAAVDPQAARKGTTFVFRGGQAELARALEGVKALLPEGMQARGAVGADVKAAMATMDTGIDAERLAGTLPKERNDTKADLTKLPELERQFAAAAAARAEQEKTGQRAPLRAQVTSAMKAKVAAMSPAEYFRHAYQDARVPGVLSAVAWDNIPRKSFVASIDIKGLKDINERSKKIFGDKRVGDQVLDLFAQVAARLDGSDFDFAHLSGDEFAAQHDSQEKLQAWIDAMEEALTKTAVPYTITEPDGDTITEKAPALFRAGIGEKTYGAADRVLNASKLKEKRGVDTGAQGRVSEGVRRPAEGQRNGGPGTHGGAEAAVPGGQVQSDPRAARAARGGSRGLQEGQPAPRRDVYQRRGAAPQGFVDAAQQGFIALAPPSSDVSGAGGSGDGGSVQLDGGQALAEDTSFDTATFDAQNAADAAETAADTAEVERVLQERTSRGPERSEERVALEAGFNRPDSIERFRAVSARFRGATAAVRRAAVDAFLAWIENLGPRPDVENKNARAVELAARKFNLVDPQAGMTALMEANKPALDKDMRRKGNRRTVALTAADRARKADQRAAFERNVLGRSTLKQDANGFTDIAAEGTDKVYRIGLTAKANRSTFLHESGHVFLDLFGELAARADAPESVRADWATTLKWFGVSAEQWAAMPIAEQTPFHEKWAVAFESYLAEGKYPSAKLAGAFQRFRLWMGSVYKRLTQLGPVAPEIAGVFDRLLATDEEIAASKRAMGLKALPRSVLGLSVEQYQAHLDKLAEATSHATQRADFAIARDQLRATESWWKEARRDAAKEAAEEYEGLKARKAQLLLRGKASGLVDFQPIALNREQVEEWVGTERAKGFLTAKDGAFADDVVEVYGGELGYVSGRELVEEVAALPDKEDFVDARADALMVERHPGVLDERQRLREVVQAGLHGSATKEWALREWAALTATGSKSNPKLPTAATLKLGAELMAAGAPAGHLGVHAALRAERAAAEAAEKAALKGDLEQALIFKQKQILNMFLFDALREARDEVARFETHAQKLTKLKARQRLGKASPVYRDAVDLLLSTFGLGEPREGLKGSLDAVLAEAERLMGEHGDTVGFDRARLVDRAETLKKDWRELPVEDLRQLERALSNIEAAARNRTFVTKFGQRLDLEAAEAELIAEAAKRPARPALPTPGAETFAERVGQYRNQLDGSMMKPERMAEVLAGTQDLKDFVKSAWYGLIVEPLQAAKAREADLYREHIAPLLQALEALPAVIKERQHELLPADLFPSHVAERVPRRRWELLVMLLNTGNASNLERLTQGRGVAEAEIRAAAQRVGITKEEYDWVQKVWDTAEALKPLAFDLEEQDSGVRPQAIEARAFQTPFGTYRGGYFPAVYDTTSAVGQRQKASRVTDFLDGSFVRASTPHSHLKSRTDGFTDLISLDLSVIHRHFAQVIHDVAYRQAIKSVATLLTREGVQAALRQSVGEGWAEQLTLAVQDIGRNRGASANDGLGFLAKLAGAARGNLVIAVLGYKLPNALEDFSSNIASALAATDLDTRHLSAAAVEFARDPMGVRELVLSKSGEMRSRQGQLRHELAKKVLQLADDSLYNKVFNRGPLGFLKDHAFVFNEAVEFSTGTPIWFGAYRQGLKQQLSEKDAVAYADATIRKVLMSHNIADLSTIMRNKGYIGQLLMFFGAFNHFYNLFRDQLEKGAAAGRAGDLKRVAQMASRAAGLSVGLFLVGALARGAGPEKGEPLEEWLLRKMVLEGYMQLVPGLNEVGNGLAAHLRGKPAVVRNNSLFGVGARLVESLMTVFDSSKEPTKRVTETINTLGPIGGTPTIGPIQSASPLIQWLAGESDWRNPLDAASDLTYGRKRDEPFNLLQGAADLIEGSPR